MIANLNFALKGTILMKIAILSDIHGNYIALQKCLDHALSQKVDSYIFLGDYLGEFPYPQKTLEILGIISMLYIGKQHYMIWV